MTLNNREIIRGQIVALKEAGLSGAEIARSLEVSRTTVSLWLKRIKEGNLSNRRCVMGAPGKITAAEEKLILEAARQQSVLNAVEIRHQLQLYHVSDKTVRRYLHKAGMRYPDPPVRETIRDNHKKARVRFATQHEDAGPDFWGRVIFSGEKSFSLNSSGKLKCWRWNEPRYKHKSLSSLAESDLVTSSFWGWQWLHGMGELVPIEEDFTADKYLEILEEVMLPSVRAYALPYPEEIVFMHNNCPIHTAKIVQRWFEEQQHIQVLKCPRLSCDLNPLEDIWTSTVSAWKPEYEKTPAQLLHHTESQWETFRSNPQTVYRQVMSVPGRLKCVLQNGGSWIG
uniref:Transposase Tc1-like domain-containing protein n=2 Tax=Scylla olivacea TaxID=85551 RepID=A0A0P4W7G1_SCYOL